MNEWKQSYMITKAQLYGMFWKLLLKAWSEKKIRNKIYPNVFNLDELITNKTFIFEFKKKKKTFKYWMKQLIFPFLDKKVIYFTQQKK